MIEIDGNTTLHVLLQDHTYACGMNLQDGGYFFVEDIAAEGLGGTMKAARLNYKNIDFCEECWDEETLALHVLREI